MPGYYQARVKSVLSGDTVVLSGVQNPKQERILSLVYVSAPRLKRDGDEVRSMHFSALQCLRISL
jgi:staphylococcal nuclease domain-containing protein 1